MKDYDGWNQVKKRLDIRENSILFKEREIWWCHMGVNIGFEVFGKGKSFNRPVLILKKHNMHTFFGLPLGTTRNHDNPHLYPIDFNGKEGSIMMAQGRTFSSKRLTVRMGALPEPVFEEIIKTFKKSF